MDRVINTLPRKNDVRIKDQELFKIKLALSSLTNSVVLCPMVANLYTQSPTDDETWTYFKRGVPGIILNHDIDRTVIAVQLCLADPDTGFAIWREALLNTSDYKATQKNFHTFKMTSNNNCMAGIRFPLDEGANIFLREVLVNIPKVSYEPKKSDVPDHKSKSLRKGGSSIKKKISKEEISKPCMFTHVTSATVMNKVNDSSKQKSRSLKAKLSGKSNKYSGSGSSLDHPDADPAQDTMSRRSVIVNKNETWLS